MPAVVFTLKIWKHYLYGETFEIFTNYKSLKYITSQKELNLRQRRWIELLKDYDYTIQYHPGKVNIVVDALSRKSLGSLSHLIVKRWQPVRDFQRCLLDGVSFQITDQGALLAQIQVQTTLIEEIKQAQEIDPHLQQTREKVQHYGNDEYRIDDDGLLRKQNRIMVPDNPILRRSLLEKAYESSYTMHPGITKMYHDLRDLYWWEGLKKDITEYVMKCLTCQQVKVEHQRLAGKLQNLDIPEWKWDKITMDFIVGLPRTLKGYDSIWVIVDRLMKSANFFPVKTSYSAAQYARLYLDEIVSLYGILILIISDRGP